MMSQRKQQVSSSDGTGSRSGRVIHVSLTGNDGSDGSEQHPLRRIATAAAQALPGDIVRVHAGVYREEIQPPRGGDSDSQPITYEAAAGERVEIRGSEPVTGWQKVNGCVWTVEVDNAIFGNFNPFADSIRGDWFQPLGRPHHTGAVYLDDGWLRQAPTLESLAEETDGRGMWFAAVNDRVTCLYANFGDCDPNTAETEINVRRTIFYPRQTGVNYIVVRGFILSRAATNWAPPTAEQVGLIGTNWSKGWIIENNTISHSRCVGLTLGKYGDEHDNTSADTANGYVTTVERAIKRGWSRDTVGGHVVRNNLICHCEQGGIAGSLGAIFSTIEHNTIHSIHVQRQFDGAEQAAIKFHAAIDCRIERNHIFNSNRGLWMDWMTQGTRICGNLCHDNQSEDLLLEVNHGPYVVDHNVFLSKISVFNWSQGGMFAHNLFAGDVRIFSDLGRDTPYMQPHSTAIAGLAPIRGGGDRFFHNFIRCPDSLDASLAPVRSGRISDRAGERHLRGDSKTFPTLALNNRVLEKVTLLEVKDGRARLSIEACAAVDGDEVDFNSTSVDSSGLNPANGFPFCDSNGNPLRFAHDLRNVPHDPSHPAPGPFARASDDASYGFCVGRQAVGETSTAH